MTVRTITQLPEVSLGELKNSDNSLMEVSYSDSHGYSSRKAKIGNFKDYVVSNLSTEIVNDYDLKDSRGVNISVSGLYDYSHRIVDQAGYFVGPKEIRRGCAWTQVDIGSEILDIVCGARNVKENMLVVVATIGTMMMDGTTIVKGNLLGEESYGVCCSPKELGLNIEYPPHHLLELEEGKVKVGEDFFSLQLN